MIVEDPNPPRPGAMNQIGLLLLRLVTGTSMIVHYSWAMVYRGWRHFWQQEEWTMINAASELSLPQPIIWAVAVSLILFFGSIFLIAGLLGRITSGLLLVCTIGLLYAAMSQPGFSHYAEICILYSGIFLTLFTTGHGILSLDRLLAMRPKRRRPEGLQDFG